MSENNERAYGTEPRVNTETIKCQACGSNMIFDPDSQMLYCEHCETRQSLEEFLPAEEMDFRTALIKGNLWNSEDTVVFHCENCGAEVVLSKNQTADSCPFCGTAHVRSVGELSGIKPNALIPFKFGKDKATEFAKHWARKKLFAPRKFKKSLKAGKVSGVYAPSFTFDCCTTSVYSARLGTRHTRVVGSGKNRRVETYIVYRDVSGTFYDCFDDVLITAGSKFDQKSVNALSPFDTNKSNAYEESYMLGFMAYHYDHEIEDCWGQAKSVIDSELKRRILAQYHYDVVSYFNVSTKHENVTYKYVMLPVYVGNFQYRKKLFNFFVNGSTGKVTGKTPVSPWKVLLAVLGVCTVIAGIVLAVYFFG